ncbi:hypothetical protein OG21DRAFT_1490136 [Imleria badia]|nr:hypothetical protein OG21DRAFT_1490136 [Imleria badia]
MTQLQSLETDPAAIERYFAKCEHYRLSGVSHPFFRDWPLSCPSRFLTPEALHHWHRFFWDHNLGWCIEALGSRELDFRFSVLPPITGVHHFSQGVTQLKQITGRTQRNAQRYIVVVLAGFPDARVVTAIRALMDFCYLAQAPAISSTTRDKIAAALAEFHQHKQAILDHSLRRSGQTKLPLKHFNFPKLELLHNVVPSINNVGSILQWTADTTEHAHIEVIKDPASMTNNMNYDAQICRTLDRDEKCRLFNTTISLIQQPESGRTEDGGDPDLEDKIDGGMNDDDANFELAEELWSPHRKATNLFAVAQRLLEAPPGSIPSPLRVFVASSTAFHLNREPSIRHMSIDDAAQKFDLPDLRGALGDYVNCEGAFAQNFHVFGGPRRSSHDAELPFNELRVWYKVRLQQKSYHDLSTLGLAFTVHAHPPCWPWKYGHYDGALLNIDKAHAWPSSSLAGHSVILVRMIMCPTSHKKHQDRCPWAGRFLVYAECLDNITQANGSVVEPSSGLHVLKQATRASGAPFDAPRLYLRLEVFVKQKLVPASKPDASLASRIFNEIESIGTAVTQAQIARQNAQSNTIPPSGPGSQPSLGYDILDARYDSLKYERRYLSIVYYQITHLGYFSPNEVQKSIDWLAANPNDATMSYILAATLAAFNSAEPHSFPGKVRKNLATDKGTITYMKRQLAPNTYWKEPGLKATILLKWTLFMAETRHCDPTLENQQGFKTEELESQIWDAVQADAFTYLAAALIQFHKRTHTSPVSSFAQFVQFVPEQQQKEPLAEEFQLPVLNMCDVLVRSLLTYASSELRKIKQRQEDLLVSVQTDRSRMFRSIAPPSSEIKDQPAPRNNIAMLYSLIGVLYVLLPPERALQFWGATPTGETRSLSYMELTETSAGKLPSFLQWAVWSTQVWDVDMTMALYDMLSGLAKGQKCSELAYNFLARGGGEVTPGSSLLNSTGSYNPGPSISWSTIFALLKSWTSPALSPRMNQPPSLAALFGGFGSLAISQPHPPTQQPPQHIPIRPKDVLLAQSFLRLLSTVAMSSVAVHLAISSNTQFCAIPTLVSLVPLGIPLELKGAIFDALAAFCEPGAGVAGVDICKSVWTLMERVKVINVRAPVSGRAVGTGAVLPPVKGVEVELDEVEAVYKLYPATIPFLNLLATLLHTPKRLSPRSLLADAEPLNTIPESLGQPYRLPGIGPYVSFMVDNVFAGLPRREYARHSERWRMNDLCLKFVERALAGWEIENLVRASEDGLLRQETVIPLLIHPGFEVLARLLTNSPLQSTILSYIVDGIEGFEHELPSEEPYFLLTIIRVLCIIHRVLEIHDVFLDVLVPILSEFDSAPFVGTVHSMSFYTRFDQALTYGTKCIPAIATYVVYPAYPELVLAVRIISQLSCSTSVTSLLILIECSPDSERILSGFRQLLDIDSLDDVDMAETTQSIVPVLVLQTEKPKSHWIKLSGSQSLTSSSVTRNVKQRTPISAISSCSAVQCQRTADENQGQGCRTTAQGGDACRTTFQCPPSAERAVLPYHLPALHAPSYIRCDQAISAHEGRLFVRHLAVIPLKVPEVSQESFIDDRSRLLTSVSTLRAFIDLRSQILDLAALDLHVLTNKGHHKGVLGILQILFRTENLQDVGRWGYN